MAITYSLKGKVAIVTGARRGIGRAIAVAIAGAGADIVACDNVIETGEFGLLQDEIQKFGQRCMIVQADISKETEVKRLFEKVEEFGGVDILVNNAAITDDTWLMELQEDVWDRVIAVNIKGTYLCSQAATRNMIARQKGGVIINMSSVGGIEAGALRPRRNPTSVYLVTKAELMMFTRMLARQVGSHNIRVNAIAPGIVKTPITAKGGKPPSWTDPEVLTFLNSLAPLGRMGEPEDIADVAVFLACDASRYINGATIVVDGGMIA